jgi:hypothetical protein
MHRHDACRLTLSAAAGSGIEKNTYSATYCGTDRLRVAAGPTTDGGSHGKLGSLRRLGLMWVGICKCYLFCKRRTGCPGFAAVYLLTRKEKEQIIDTRACAVGGSHLAKRCSGYLPPR